MNCNSVPNLHRVVSGAGDNRRGDLDVGKMGLRTWEYCARVGIDERDRLACRRDQIDPSEALTSSSILRGEIVARCGFEEWAGTLLPGKGAGEPPRADRPRLRGEEGVPPSSASRRERRARGICSTDDHPASRRRRSAGACTLTPALQLSMAPPAIN
jgi:hypothetical protein